MFTTKGRLIPDDKASDFKAEFNTYKEAEKYLNDQGFMFKEVCGAGMDKYEKPIGHEVKGKMQTLKIVATITYNDLFPPYYNRKEN